MRGLAVLAAAGAGWALARGPLPRVTWRISVPRPTVPRIAASVGTAAAVGALTLGLTGVPVVAASVGLLAAAGPLVAASLHTGRSRAQALDLWPDMLAILRGELAGGHSLPEAFVAAARRAGGPMAQAGEQVAEHLGAGGSFEDALAELRGGFSDPVADRVLVTVAIAQRTGGARVSALVGTLSASVADELRLRKAHHAALTQQRLTAGVALIAPWALLVLTVVTNATAAQAYRSGSGSIVVAGGLVATLTGYFLALRTARLSRPPRVFR